MCPGFATNCVNEALIDTRVVLICGPSQSGKTTLARQIAHNKIPFITLDDPTVLKSVSADPVGFARNIDRAVIDGAHRASDLILAIKASVDTDPRPGRFLLTGSANLATLPHLHDSLAGRMATTHLLPLAQSELLGNRSLLLDQLFAGEVPAPSHPVVGNELIQMAVEGGYPEVLVRTRWRSRQNWHLGHSSSGMSAISQGSSN